LERLAVIAEIRGAPEANGGAGESLRRELRERVIFHLAHERVQLTEIERACLTAIRADVMILDVAVEQPERRDRPRPGRHGDLQHLELARHAGGEERTVAA